MKRKKKSRSRFRRLLCILFWHRIISHAPTMDDAVLACSNCGRYWNDPLDLLLWEADIHLDKFLSGKLPEPMKRRPR